MHVVMCILGVIGTLAFIMALGNKLLLEPAGCFATLFGLILPIGGYIGGNVAIYGEFGALGMGLFNILGVVLGIVGIIIFKSDRGSSSNYTYSSRNSSNSSSANDNKCISCLYHRSSGECFCLDSPRHNGITAADDSCTHWKKY